MEDPKAQDHKGMALILLDNLMVVHEVQSTGVKIVPMVLEELVDMVDQEAMVHPVEMVVMVVAHPMADKVQMVVEVMAVMVKMELKGQKLTVEGLNKHHNNNSNSPLRIQMNLANNNQPAALVLTKQL